MFVRCPTPLLYPCTLPTAPVSRNFGLRSSYEIDILDTCTDQRPRNKKTFEVAPLSPPPPRAPINFQTNHSIIARPETCHRVILSSAATVITTVLCSKQMSIRLLSQSVGKLLSKKFARPSTVPFQRFSMVHVPFRHQLNRVNDLVQRRPVLTSIVVTGVKAWAADLMIQKLVEKRETVDLKRSALFASFGSAYQGCIQYWIYNILFEKRLFPGKSPQMILMKIAATNLIVDPVIFFPIFYTMREAMNTERLLDVNLPNCFSTSMAKYRDNCRTDLINSWMIWVPAHCVTYTVVPVHLRMPWIAVVSFGYVCVLSFTRGEAGK